MSKTYLRKLLNDREHTRQVFLAKCAQVRAAEPGSDEYSDLYEQADLALDAWTEASNKQEEAFAGAYASSSRSA